MVPGIEHRHLSGSDGTRVAYQVRGQGPAIVFANGLGGSYKAFVHLYAALGMGYRIVCWDYRGLFGSAVPVDRATLSVPHQCDDLERILDHEGIERAVFLGWSMGVQVNFEFARRRSARMDGIVAINGTYGSPFRSALSSRMVRHVIPSLLRAIGANAELVGRATRRVVAWDGLFDMIRRFGLVSPTADAEVFREVAGGFETVDWKVYSELMARLGEHDARDVLTGLHPPLLVITGDRDMLTPAFIAEKIHRAVPGSRLVVIEGGTHYTPVEFPDIVAEELLSFLGRISGYEPAAVAGAVAKGAAPWT